MLSSSKNVLECMKTLKGNNEKHDRVSKSNEDVFKLETASHVERVNSRPLTLKTGVRTRPTSSCAHLLLLTCVTVFSAVCYHFS